MSRNHIVTGICDSRKNRTLRCGWRVNDSLLEVRVVQRIDISKKIAYSYGSQFHRIVDKLVVSQSAVVQAESNLMDIRKGLEQILSQYRINYLVAVVQRYLEDDRSIHGRGSAIYFPNPQSTSINQIRAVDLDEIIVHHMYSGHGWK